MQSPLRDNGDMLSRLLKSIAFRTAAWVSGRARFALACISRWRSCFGVGGGRRLFFLSTILLQVGVEVEIHRAEVARGAGFHSYSFDVLRYGEVVGVLCTHLVLDTDVEDGEVVELYILAHEQELLDVGHGIDEDAP